MLSFHREYGKMSCLALVTRTGRRAAPAAMALLFPILLMAQYYVFGPNVRVNDDSPGVSNHMLVSPGQHSIAARGNTVYLAWRDDRNPYYASVYFARSTNGGASFLPNVKLNRPECSAGLQSLALDDSGRIHVCWLNCNPAGGYFTYYTKSNDGGQSFLPPVRSCDSFAGSQYAYPSLAVSRSGKYIYVARSEHSWHPDSTYRVLLSRSTDGGTTFLVPDTRVFLDSLAGIVRQTIAVFQDTIVLVAAEDGLISPNQVDVYFARSTNGGASFDSSMLLNDTAGNNLNQTDPSIGVDTSGRVYVIYTGGGQGQGFGLVVSGDTGRTFASPRLIPDAQQGPSLFVSPGGKLYVSWYATGYQDPGEWFTFSSDGGNTFLPAMTPSDIPASESILQWESTVAANEDGRVFVAWSDNRFNPWGFTEDIMFSTGVRSSVEDISKLADTTLRCEVVTNPAFGAAAIRYCLPARGHASLEVFDQSGRRVRVLERGSSAAGQGERTWNGRDDAGRPIATGIYFIRLSTPFGNRSGKVMLIM